MASAAAAGAPAAAAAPQRAPPLGPSRRRARPPREKETSAHRRLRRRRADARVVAKLAAVIASLANHHGSALPRPLARALDQVACSAAGLPAPPPERPPGTWRSAAAPPQATGGDLRGPPLERYADAAPHDVIGVLLGLWPF